VLFVSVVDIAAVDAVVVVDYNTAVFVVVVLYTVVGGGCNMVAVEAALEHAGNQNEHVPSFAARGHVRSHNIVLAVAVEGSKYGWVGREEVRKHWVAKTMTVDQQQQHLGPQE